MQLFAVKIHLPGAILFRTIRFPAATALLIGLPITACQDLPTAPMPGESSRSTVFDIPAPTNSDAFLASRTHLCYVSGRTEDGAGYNFGRLSIRFPTAMLPEDGSTQLYRYRLMEPGAAPGAPPLGAGNCRIPNTPKAREFMDRRLGVVRRRVGAGRDDGEITTQSDPCPDKTYGCWLPGLVVIGYPTGPAWPGGGVGGGGGWDASYSYTYYQPGPSYEPDIPEEPCATGSPVLDDPMINEGFARLWSQSNVEAANFMDRHEQIGWIVKTETGYRIQEVATGNFCGWEGTMPYPAEGTAAIIGYIHTHPYRIGELIPICDYNTGRVSGYRAYDGTPSDADRYTSEKLGADLGRGPLLGIILDADGIRAFMGQDLTPEQNPRIERCGY